MRASFVRLLAVVSATIGLAITTASAQDDSSAGQTLLASIGCAACHGDTGQGTALAPSIVGAAISREAFIAATRNGRGSMPAFSADAVSDDVLVSLHEYLAAQSSVSQPAGDAVAGASRYEQIGCYSCHSNQGQGVLHGPRIAPRPIRWGRFVWYVRQPSGQMPPYSDVVVSDAELADIYAFLASRPVPPPVDDIPLLRP